MEWTHGQREDFRRRGLPSVELARIRNDQTQDRVPRTGREDGGNDGEKDEGIEEKVVTRKRLCGGRCGRW